MIQTRSQLSGYGSRKPWNDTSQQHSGTLSVHMDYTLNKRRALEKKLNHCQRNFSFRYETRQCNQLRFYFQTGYYELFRNGIDVWFNRNKSAYAITTREKIDAGGNTTETIYQVRQERNGILNYTLNLYHTTTSALINGNNVKQFLTIDFSDVMKQIEMNGCDVTGANIKFKKLLEEYLKMERDTDIADSKSSRNSQGSAGRIEFHDMDEDEDSSDEEVSCMKCRKKVKSRAVRCNMCRVFVHYFCDKLNEDEIRNVEREESTYICRMCRHSGNLHALDAEHGEVKDQSTTDHKMKEDIENLTGSSGVVCETCKKEACYGAVFCQICENTFHYECEKMAPEEINNLPNIDDYTCKSCRVMTEQLEHKPTDENPAGCVANVSDVDSTWRPEHSQNKTTSTHMGENNVQDNLRENVTIPKETCSPMNDGMESMTSRAPVAMVSILKQRIPGKPQINIRQNRSEKPSQLFGSTTHRNRQEMCDNLEEKEKDLKARERKLSKKEEFLRKQELQLNEQTGQIASLRVLTSQLEIKINTLEEENRLLRLQMKIDGQYHKSEPRVNDSSQLDKIMMSTFTMMAASMQKPQCQCTDLKYQVENLRTMMLMSQQKQCHCSENGTIKDQLENLTKAVGNLNVITTQNMQQHERQNMNHDEKTGDKSCTQNSEPINDIGQKDNVRQINTNNDSHEDMVKFEEWMPDTYDSVRLTEKDSEMQLLGDCWSIPGIVNLEVEESSTHSRQGNMEGDTQNVQSQPLQSPPIQLNEWSMRNDMWQYPDSPYCNDNYPTFSVSGSCQSSQNFEIKSPKQPEHRGGFQQPNLGQNDMELDDAIVLCVRAESEMESNQERLLGQRECMSTLSQPVIQRQDTTETILQSKRLYQRGDIAHGTYDEGQSKVHDMMNVIGNQCGDPFLWMASLQNQTIT